MVIILTDHWKQKKASTGGLPWMVVIYYISARLLLPYLRGR